MLILRAMAACDLNGTVLFQTPNETNSSFFQYASTTAMIENMMSSQVVINNGNLNLNSGTDDKR